jgi:hypothetical protein
VLGHEHAAASSPVQLLEGGLIATTDAEPRRPPSVSLLLLLLASVLALGGLASEPGMLAYATMLLLLCSLLCCDAIAALLELVL